MHGIKIIMVAPNTYINISIAHSLLKILSRQQQDTEYYNKDIKFISHYVGPFSDDHYHLGRNAATASASPSLMWLSSVKIAIFRLSA